MTSEASIAGSHTPEPPCSLAQLWTLLLGVVARLQSPAGPCALAIKQQLLQHPWFAHLSAEDFEVRACQRGAHVAFDVVGRDGRSLLGPLPQSRAYLIRHNLRAARRWIEYRRFRWRIGSVLGLTSGLPWSLPRPRRLGVAASAARPLAPDASLPMSALAARGPP